MMIVSLSSPAQNRDHLYNFLLLKINLFNHWVSGLAQEARGSCNWQAHLPLGAAACPLGRALRAGLALIQVPVWLVLQGPRLMWAGMWGGTRALGLALLSAWEQLGLSVAIWTDLFLSCLHGLMLVALLLVIVTWRVCQKAHCFRPDRQLSKVGGFGVRLGCGGQTWGVVCDQGWLGLRGGATAEQCNPMSS